MIHRKIFFTNRSDKVYLEAFVMETDGTSPRDAMLVFPGGGYCETCFLREGERVALAYLARGINAFALQYITDGTQKYPEHLLIAAEALHYVKEHAEEFCINPDRVFGVGFSAGGHLCGNLMTEYAKAEQLLGYDKNSLRLCGGVLAYPVISATCLTHSQSFSNLLGKPFDMLTDEEKREHSLEYKVNCDTPPAFIWHTAQDTTVSPHGSLKLAMAYLDAGVPVAYHLYPYGPHGVCLADENCSQGNEAYIQPLADGWLNASVEWMKSIR